MSTVSAPVLEIALDRDNQPVSILSSLLRVVQAALREVARSSDDAREAFTRQPQPVLCVSTVVEGQCLVLRFSFADPLNSTPLADLSADIFNAFMERFVQLLKALPQPGLWRDSVGGAQRRPFESEVSRRLDQVRLELRRLPRARVRFDQQTILFERNRMEIG